MVPPPGGESGQGGMDGGSHSQLLGPGGYHKTQSRLARLAVLRTSQCEPRFEKQPQGQRFISVGETSCVSSEESWWESTAGE